MDMMGIFRGHGMLGVMWRFEVSLAGSGELRAKLRSAVLLFLFLVARFEVKCVG